jgi:hypothetical protein
MWGPWMSFHYGIQKNDIVNENLSLDEIVAMWDGIKA